MFLVLACDQIFRLKQQALQDAQSSATPQDEVGDVVPGEECSRASRRQEADVPQDAEGHGQRSARRGGDAPGWCGAAGHGQRPAARLAPRHELLRGLAHRVSMLQKQRKTIVQVNLRLNSIRRN